MKVIDIIRKAAMELMHGMRCGCWISNSYSTGARDLRCHKSLTTVLYIPPDWSLRHTWSVHSIHEKMATPCIMWRLLFVHDVHQTR